MDRGHWLALWAMGHGGFTTPEIEEERYQRDVKRGSLLPDMTVEELSASFNAGMSMEEIQRHREDPSLWEAHYDKRYRGLTSD